MTGSNGRADTVGPPIQLGDFFPERRQVLLNGQQYLAWVATNKRYPRSIMARLDRAARVYNRVVGPLLAPRTEDEELTADRIVAMESQPEAWEQYITECIMLLVPGLLETEVELIGLDVLEGLLRDLGYFRNAADRAQDAEDAPESDPLTGDTAPDASLIFTQDTTPILS